MTLGVGCCYDADGVRDHKRRESFFDCRDLGERNDQLVCLVSKRDKEGKERREGEKEKEEGLGEYQLITTCWITLVFYCPGTLLVLLARKQPRKATKTNATAWLIIHSFSGTDVWS